MADLIRSIIMYVIVIGLMVAVFKFLKVSQKAVIEPTDHSMEPEYGYGGYRFDGRPNEATAYKGGDQGDVVAYWVPGKPESCRIARVLAVAGERVEIQRKNAADPKSALVVKVNGQLVARFQPDRDELRFPEIVVPRGCLFLMAEKPSLGEDSMTAGPVPYYCIRGKVN